MKRDLDNEGSYIMKAEVITLQNIKNYGSMLQAFATQELLKEVGFVPEILD